MVHGGHRRSCEQVMPAISTRENASGYALDVRCDADCDGSRVGDPDAHRRTILVKVERALDICCGTGATAGAMSLYAKESVVHTMPSKTAILAAVPCQENTTLER